MSHSKKMLVVSFFLALWSTVSLAAHVEFPISMLANLRAHDGFLTNAREQNVRPGSQCPAGMVHNSDPRDGSYCFVRNDYKLNQIFTVAANGFRCEITAQTETEFSVVPRNLTAITMCAFREDGVVSGELHDTLSAGLGHALYARLQSTTDIGCQMIISCARDAVYNVAPVDASELAAAMTGVLSIR